MEQERLARMRAENAKMKREHIPVELVEEIAAELVTEVRGNLDGLVGNVKKRIPHLRAAGVSQVRQEVVKISNAIVDY